MVSGATASVFKSRHLLVNLAEIEPVQVRGIGGDVTCRFVGSYGRLKGVHLCPQSPANVIAVVELIEQSHSSREKPPSSSRTASVIAKREGRLYVIRSGTAEAMLHVTVSGLAARFTPQERARAAKAHKLIETLGYPSTRDVVRALKTGSLGGADVTAQDVIRAGIIFGQHSPSLAGKMHDRAVSNIMEETSQVEVKDQVLYIDVAFEDGVPGIIGVAKPLDVIMYADLPMKYDAASTTAGIKQLLGLLRQRGFGIKKVVADADTRC
jgi:hypothetical protein